MTLNVEKYKGYCPNLLTGKDSKVYISSTKSNVDAETLNIKWIKKMMKIYKPSY